MYRHRSTSHPKAAATEVLHRSGVDLVERAQQLQKHRLPMILWEDWVPQMLVFELFVLRHLHNIDTYCHGVLLAACAPVLQHKLKSIVVLYGIVQ